MSITASAYWAFFKYSFSISRTICKIGAVFHLRSMTLRHEGYFHSAVYHGKKGEILIADVVKITAGIFAIKIAPVWTHGDKNDYTAYAHFHPKYSEFIIGRWAHNITEKRFGTFVFKINDSGDSKKIFGKYIGVSTSNNIQSSAWLLERTATIKQYNYYSFTSKFKRFFMKRRDIESNLLDSIVDKHKGYFATTNPEPFEYEDLKFVIPNNGFNPKFGKISRPLIEQVINSESLIGKSILDVGTGSGFYAILLAKLGAEETFGTDINAEIIDVAASNAKINKVQNTTFMVSEKNDLFSNFAIKKKFDIIVANLPFTSAKGLKKISDTPIYDNFLGNDSLLLNFLIGSRMHLKEGGSIYMSFGLSGDEKALNQFCQIAGLKRERLLELKSKDDDFYIYKITKLDIGLKFHSSISDMAQYVKDELAL